ncbi:Na+/H+ antiporter NhaA [Sphingomonas sp. NFX23]
MPCGDVAAGGTPRGVVLADGALNCTLSGIGFTISLFIANLAFPDVQRTEMASLAVLIASVVSAGRGYVALRWASGSADVQPDHV